MSYKIAIAHGAAFNPDGTPQQHTLMRMLKTVDLIRSGEAQEAYFCGLNEGERMYDYTVSRLGVDPDSTRIEPSSWSAVSNMARVRKDLDRRVNKGKIPSDSALICITTDWAKPRFEFDADWILRNYPHEIVGVEDGRSAESDDYKHDIVREKTAFLIDRLSAKVPIISNYNPELAQRLVLGVGGVVKDPETGNWNYGNLAWALFGIGVYLAPVAARFLSGNLDSPVLPEITPSQFSSLVPGYPTEKLLVNFIAPGGVAAKLFGDFFRYAHWEKRNAEGRSKYIKRLIGATTGTALFTMIQAAGYATQLGGDIWEGPRAYLFNLVYGAGAGSLAPYVPEVVKSRFRKVFQH